MVQQSKKELIAQRRRQILVHSCIYYRMNNNIISDHTYDKWCRELVELQSKYKIASMNAPFYEAFKDFDGSTGYDLPIHDGWVVSKALQIMELHKQFR